MGARPAGDDTKAFAGRGRRKGQYPFPQAGDTGQGRQITGQGFPEKGDGLRGTLDLDPHPIRAVAHLAGKSMRPREAVDKGTKTHALHLTADEKEVALGRFGFRHERISHLKC